MTDEARDVIENALAAIGYGTGPQPPPADAILAALTAAGYVLLSPADIERENKQDEAALQHVAMEAGREGYAAGRKDASEPAP